MTSRVTEADFPAGRWRAQWIWSRLPSIRRRGLFRVGGGEADASWTCFRRCFELEAVPARVPARLTVDSRYVLWINGSEASRGPVRSNLRRLHYDALDLAPLLRPGRNVIAVLARFFGAPNPWWAPVPPAVHLGAGALVFEARLEGGASAGDEWLVSDERWRALAADAFEDLPAEGIGGMPSECCDATRLPPGWIEVDFDDGDWSPATRLPANHLGFGGRHEPPSHPYGPLLPRPVPPLGCTPRAGRIARVATAQGAGEDAAGPFARAVGDARRATGQVAEEDGFPLALPAAPEAAHVVTVDFGEVVAGTVVLDLEAPAGTCVDAAAVEFLDAQGRPDPDGERSGFRYRARGSEDRWETLTPFGLRALVLSLRSSGPLRLRSVSVNERLMPRPDGPFFECSDSVLNRIWAVGRRSVDLNSHDVYLDCPTREQRGWTGDFVVHQMVDLVTNPDWRLACWNVEMAASPRPDGMLPMAAGGDIEQQDVAYIPDWALHWIRALHNLYRYTGDRTLVGRLLPVAEGVLRWFVPFRDRDGLLTDVTGWVIIDWSSVTTDGKSSVLNALWARGLRDFAEMAAWLGDAGRAAWARAQRDRVARGFELFWDPERRLYVDHAIGTARGRPVSQHAQAAPLAAGIVPPERVERAVDVMLDATRLVHATWSVPDRDARRSDSGRALVGGPYLVTGPPPPWWDVENQIVCAQPFFRYVVHDALAEAGQAQRIAAACRDWEALLARCATSWSETWFGGTVSHGWCATPTRDLLVRTLGVAPEAPGFVRAHVAPRLGDLAWARGAVPTPRGLLSVEASPDRVAVESPVPFVLDRGAAGDAEAAVYPPGRHEIR